MLTVKLLLLMCVCEMTGQNSSSSGHIDYFKNGLKYGPFQVGYKQMNLIDAGRPSLKPVGYTNLKMYGREMQLHIWYPAVKTSGNPILYKTYFSPAIDPKATREIFFNTIKDLSGDTSLFTSTYEHLVNIRTKAFKNASLSKGSFPLIIYPDLVYAQSILSEYLASQGFIIVSPIIKGTNAAPMEYTVQGIETGVADIEFALSYMRRHYSINREFGFMGIGFNATLGLALQLRNKDNIALVSFEGGITTPFESDLIRKSPYFNLQELNKSMLIIYAPHPDVKPELTYPYKFADRVYQYYNQSSEFYFLNYGIWEKSIKNIFPKANKGDTGLSFEYAATSIDQYFKWNLKHNEKYKAKLFLSSDTSGIVQTTYRPAALLPLSKEELLSKISSEGIGSMRVLIEERKKTDPLPISFNSYFTVSQVLIEKTKFNELSEWAKLFESSFPLSAIPFSLSGRANLELGNRVEALKYYQKAYSLIGDDQELNAEEKSTFKAAIENRVKSLIDGDH